jgi:ribosomal protein S18 acetylase RimI-like enzyme
MIMHKDELHFVKGKPWEYEIALDIFYNAAVKLKADNVDHWQFWLDPTEDRKQMIIDAFNKGEFSFVMDQNGSRVGMFRLIYNDPFYWEDKDEYGYYVHGFATDPKFRGLGIGVKVLSMIEQMAIQENINFIRLDCKASNVGLCNYYESLGFKKMGQKLAPQSLNNLYEKRLIS